LSVRPAATAGVVGGKLAMAHGLIRMVRQLVNYGATILENKECERLVGIIRKMRFKMAKARTERLTVEYANAIREMAHHMNMRSPLSHKHFSLTAS
jgi:adenylate kinase